MAVYVDVLLAVNFAVDYLLLKAAALFCGVRAKEPRLISAAALGAAGSLIIFFPPNSPAAEFIYRGAASAAVCAVAFCPCKIKRLIRAVFGFLAASFIFSGTVLLWQITFKPMGVISCAGAVYFDIGVPALIICSALGYAAACLLSDMLHRRMPLQSSCRITVINNGSSVSLNALIDSGSSLVEPFSNAPVIVCQSSALKETMPRSLAQGRGIRLIPYKTLDSNGLLSAFLPEKMFVTRQDGKLCEIENCYIAVTDKIPGENYKAICNPGIFLNQKAGEDICADKI